MVKRIVANIKTDDLSKVNFFVKDSFGKLINILSHQ
ncbi:hypothetical protein M2372_000166 [Chryseobacterium sp. BIGb0232]|nr:hypothetical protein [Chryseobacterium sp. BIGb0232]ROS20385.1 hypothetical protein EDF65_1102 [Chryseobacterium nakagawai]